MSRIARRAVACAIALALAGVASAKEKPQEAPAQKAAAGSSTWYAQRITHGDAPVSVEHFWSKGRKLRAEMVVQGMPVLTLVNGETYTIVDPARLVGIAIRRAPEAIAADAKHPG